jgi:hypothetical protein
MNYPLLREKKEEIRIHNWKCKNIFFLSVVTVVTPICRAPCATLYTLCSSQYVCACVYKCFRDASFTHFTLYLGKIRQSHNARLNGFIIIFDLKLYWDVCKYLYRSYQHIGFVYIWQYNALNLNTIYTYIRASYTIARSIKWSFNY